VKLPKKFTRDGWRMVIANWSLDGARSSMEGVTVASSGILRALRASRFSEWVLKSLELSLDNDESGKVRTGNGWSSITSVIKVEVILITATRVN
jgi:hypothetical protein